MKILTQIVFIAVILFLPLLADTCPMCQGGASKEKLDAYILTTGILGGLPIVMVVLFFFLFRRVFRETNLKP